MSQIAHGRSDLYCPLWRKAMSKVCHTCPWWAQYRGTNPNTGEEIDEWRCGVAMTPVAILSLAQKTNEMGAAVESARNESVKAHQQDMQLQVALINEVRSSSLAQLASRESDQLALPMPLRTDG